MFSIRCLRLYFPGAGALVFAVCFTLPPFLLVYLCANVGSRGLLAVALPARFVPQSATSLGLPATTLWDLLAATLPALFHNPPRCWVCQPPPYCKSSPPGLPISAPPTGLDECFFFSSLAVTCPYSSIFCQFWLFLFLNCCCPSFGCGRRHSVSTYASILSRSEK